MKVDSGRIKCYRRKLRDPMITSRGPIAERSGFILAATADTGHTGYGEIGLPLDTGGTTDNESRTTLEEMLNDAAAALRSMDIPSSLDDVAAKIKPLMATSDPAVYFGFETALCDLAARVVDRPLRHWLNQNAHDAVPVNFLVSRPVENWEELAATVSERGYRAVKTKVATGPVVDDVEFVRQLRASLGDAIAVRLDANRGWDYETAKDLLVQLQPFGIDYIEEPLHSFTFEQYASLQKETRIRCALDESVGEAVDLQFLISSGVCPVLVLKPARLGGIAETISIVRLARNAGRRTVITSNLETEIGTAALFHLVASAYDDIPVCGLDTLRMFEKADPVLTRVEDGSIGVPPGPGLGLGEEMWQTL